MASRELYVNYGRSRVPGREGSERPTIPRLEFSDTTKVCGEVVVERV